MKKVQYFILAVMVVGATLFFTSFTQKSEGKTEFTQITTIESVVPGGLGRSRMITIGSTGEMEEVNMENFFSLGGINFKNVRYNDKMITDKITQMSNDGWELVQATPGVYAADKSTGIFITRYLFKKAQ